jgi:hypothetical protein
MSRFPFPDFPTGWFHVAYSRDVPPGSVVPLQYFGQELICYRGESGHAQVMDAFCPHLGALTVTPIDGEYVEARYTFLAPRDPQIGEISRLGQGFVRDFMKQIEQDLPIWEHKVYRPRPSLATGEGPIMEFRRWAEHSYAAPAPVGRA